MAFEANNFNVAKKFTLPKSQLNVECSVTCEGASKILSVSAEACQNGNEVIAGTVNYTGYIDLCVVFLTEDGQIGKTNSICPFSSKFSGEQIENGQKADINVKVLDCQIDGVSGDNVRCNCLLEERCVLTCNCLVKSVKCNDEDLCVLQENIDVVNFVGQACQQIEVSSQFALRENVKRVILSESQAFVKSTESGEGFATISGDVVLRVLYLTEDDKFESGYVYDSFKEEIELEGVSQESKVEGYATVKRDSVKVTLDQNEKGGTITLTTPLTVCVKAYNFVEQEVIKDLYSTKNELAITTSSFSMSQICSSTVVEGKIDGSLTLDEERPRVDKILFVGTNNVNVTNCYFKDGEIVIEGVAKSNVVYLNDDEGALSSVVLEVPFVVADKYDEQLCDGDIDVQAIVCDVDVVVKKGRELFYDGKIKANINVCHDVVSGVISNVERADEFPEKDCGMELVFARAGQTSWDVAKEARVKEEMLLSQNQDVVFPLAEDAALILFYQKTN